MSRLSHVCTRPMQLPNAANASIADAKLVDYLLNVNHPYGASKAAWLLRYGYRQTHPEVLAADLLLLAQRGNATPDRLTEEGQQYVIIGLLETPTGEQTRVRTVWQIDHGTDY